MSQFHNNNLIHNLRVAVEMVQAGMSPKLTSAAMNEVGINAPANLIEAVAQPGIMDSMSAKPFTHERAKQNISAHQILQGHLATMRTQAEESEHEYAEADGIED